jgi:hypothetical protein
VSLAPELCSQRNAVLFNVVRASWITSPPDPDGHILLHFIEQVEQPADLGRVRRVTRRAVATPERLLAHAAVVEHRELDLDITPQRPVEINQTGEVALGICKLQFRNGSWPLLVN